MKVSDFQISIKGKNFIRIKQRYRTKKKQTKNPLEITFQAGKLFGNINLKLKLWTNMWSLTNFCDFFKK